jgi:hypothetical protein
MSKRAQARAGRPLCLERGQYDLQAQHRSRWNRITGNAEYVRGADIASRTFASHQASIPLLPRKVHGCSQVVSLVLP